MTYCVAMNLDEGLVFVSDSRTNAGVDHIASFRKLYTFGVPGERLVVLQAAGNLASTQAVVSLLRQRLHSEAANLLSVPTLFDAARLVGETLREVVSHDAMPDIDVSCSFLLGGQIRGEPPMLYNIYPQGNFIAATTDTPYFQIGESKYGKPILDRALRYGSSLDMALRCALISIDSTIRSNLSVGLPLDLLVYRRDSLEIPEGYRVSEHDPYFESMRQHWCSSLRRILLELPSVPDDYLK